MSRPTPVKRARRTQGSHWIRPEKRLAIYLRDGLACAYCGAPLEAEGTLLTLDHVTPYARGGGNGEANLVTACLRCNSARGDRPLAAFARAVGGYTGEAPESVVRRVNRLRRRALDVADAKAIINQRGDLPRTNDRRPR